MRLRSNIQQHTDGDNHRNNARNTTNLNVAGVLVLGGGGHVPPTPPLAREQLCYGHFRPTIKIKGLIVPVKPFLMSQYPYSSWSMSPHEKRTFTNANTNDAPVTYEGTIRSQLCDGLAVDLFNESNKTNTCHRCSTVVRSSDFVRAVLRYNAIQSSLVDNAYIKGLKHAHWTAEMFRGRILHERTIHAAELQALRTRSRAARKTLLESSWVNTASRDVQGCIRDLKAILDTGSFDETETWFKFWIDTVHNRKLRIVNEEGKRWSRNSRYHPETWDFVLANQLVSGPKGNRMLKNIMAPNRSNVDRALKVHRRVLWPGVDSRNFTWAAEVPFPSFSTLRSSHLPCLRAWGS